MNETFNSSPSEKNNLHMEFYFSSVEGISRAIMHKYRQREMKKGTMQREKERIGEITECKRYEMGRGDEYESLGGNGMI